MTVPVHIYGVTDTSVTIPADRTGRSKRPLRHIEGDGLRVLVSDVDADSRVLREDLMAHAHTLEAVATLGTVLPMQFGVEMPDDDTVRHELIESRGDEIRPLLERFDGLLQLTVSVDLIEQEALREALRRDPDLVALRDEVRRASPQERHSAEVRLGEAIAAALDVLRAGVGDGVVDQLAPTARAVSLGEVRGALQAAEIFLLVERDRQSEVDATVTTLREDLAPLASLRYVGPQPPYAFLDAASSGALAWA
ncbi:GvpL/GvpF family gas vesicle protein [Nocardioides sp. YIM B13467]|uniref:GvpL/GvpF family gas vesicle protein n=1 Tax=Nocardioides sp. YIM B13467 TaxID=3366294 RepID=UPI00366DCF8A